MWGKANFEMLLLLTLRQTEISIYDLLNVKYMIMELLIAYIRSGLPDPTPEIIVIRNTFLLFYQGFIKLH